MKIIAVNISVNHVRNNQDILKATERAWELTVAKCNEYKYVIGVAGGKILGYYLLLEAFEDKELPDRVAFELEECTSDEKSEIKNIIEKNNINLSYFVKKYILIN